MRQARRARTHYVNWRIIISTANHSKTAIVAGAGPGLGQALCQQFAAAGYQVAGFSRSAQPFNQLATSYLPVSCDLTDPASIDTAVTRVENEFGTPSVYIHNAASLLNNPFLETSGSEFCRQWETTCLAAIHGYQRILPTMLKAHTGTLLAIGATASIKAGSGFAAFSSAKFALRGLMQSLAREFGPQGIHVAHLVIDGAIWGNQAKNKFGLEKDRCLQPTAVAETCLNLVNQQHSAWTQELDLRPDVESF